MTGREPSGWEEFAFRAGGLALLTLAALVWIAALVLLCMAIAGAA